MNKILVPVDFSDISMNALFYAIKLFESSNFEITLLHTYDMSSNAFSVKSMDRILADDAKQQMETLLDKVYKEEPGIVLKTKILKGDAIPAISKLGNSGAYDFIVMGTKGASGLKEVFLGSVAGGVISKTKAPVLVVPGSYTFKTLNEIVFAVSGIVLSNKTVVEPLRKLAKLHQCKIKVLHIDEGKMHDFEEVLKTIEDLNPSVTFAFGSGKINQRLNEFLIKNDAGLQCLIRGKKNIFSRIFDDSVTLKQTFNSPVPLLIIHN
jgi:nucleotide-binding universal stress UspA family protein